MQKNKKNRNTVTHNKKINIGVIIATSNGRTELLFSRSLKSVLDQSLLPDYILIVDDNNNNVHSHEIQERIRTLQKKSHNTSIYYSRNTHTKGMSGTGSWNTGFSWYDNKFKENDYIAILDDDDSWDKTYIEKCIQRINMCDHFPDQIAAYLKRSDSNNASIFSHDDITISNFLIRNPGIQGSNMFFRFGIIKKTGGFDEHLQSCTDRDFMINILMTLPCHHIEIIPEILIRHFSHPLSVTHDFAKKTKGLDVFYRKHIALYTQDVLDKSLVRSEMLFKYPNSNNIQKLWKLVHLHSQTPKIVIGVAVHNSQKTLLQCIKSILQQQNIKSEIWTLVMDDSSSDNWKDTIQQELESEKIIYWNESFMNVSKTRNCINSFIKEYFGNVKLIGRLDSDDEFAHPYVLSEIEKIKDNTDADYIIAGNYLKQEGKILGNVNYANQELLNHKYLLNRLKQMAEGTAKNELPSCNLFMSPKYIQKYPNIPSAEDHYLTAKILWNRDKRCVILADKIIATIYSLDGNLTYKNKQNNKHKQARIKIYNEIKKWK